MSSHHGGDIVGIEMDDVNREVDPDDDGDQSSASTGSPFKNRFASILEVSEDEKAWRVAANDLLASDVDFGAKVSCTFSRLRVRRTIRHSLWWRTIHLSKVYTRRLQRRSRKKGWSRSSRLLSK